MPPSKFMGKYNFGGQARLQLKIWPSTSCKTFLYDEDMKFHLLAFPNVRN